MDVTTLGLVFTNFIGKKSTLVETVKVTGRKPPAEKLSQKSKLNFFFFPV
jgi:hypothetical protein